MSCILVWAALFGTTTMDTIKAATVSTPTKLVDRWVRENLGPRKPGSAKTWVRENLGLTVQSKRTQFDRILRTKTTGNPQET